MSHLDLQRKKDLSKVIAVSVGVSAVLLVGIHQLSMFIAAHPDHPSVRWLVALTGITLTGVVVLAMRSVRRMDELERKMHVEAMASAFLCSIFLIACYTFLGVAGLETPPVTWLLPGMMVCWNIGLLLAVVRYR